ncbi:MAG: metallophosphoesterase family protein [Negativicutes bacterium]|nr:metallophosphoesterase family protein [Negativicutes bacterium]
MEKETTLLDLAIEKNRNISRRSLLKAFGASLLLAGLPLNLTKVLADEKSQLGAGVSPDHVMLTWDMDPRTTQTIAWRTDSDPVSGFIQWVKTDVFGKSAWNGAGTTAASTDQLNTDLGDMTIHFTTLTGLNPGTKYTYRVGDGENWSTPYDFTTEQSGDKPFEFLVFGDSQSGLANNPEYSPWRTTVHNASAAHPAAAFFMVIGDLVEVGQSYEHWNNWYAAAKDVIEKVPLMAVLGNHETYDVLAENHSSLPFYFTRQIKLPSNGPEPLKGQAYSFDYGNAHFAVIDSQEAEEGQYMPDMLQREAAWLDQDLAAAGQKWKLVFFHKTPYYNKAIRANEKIKAALLPIIDKHHVDLVVNGHDHGYSRTYPLAQDSFVDSPAKGTVYVVAGRSGNKFYTDLSQKVWDAVFHDPQAEPNYVVIGINGDKLSLKAYTQSRSLIDDYVIDKRDGTDSPRTVLPERSNETRLVVWGNMLQTPLISVSPRKIADAWYIPLQPFFEFIGGAVESPDAGQMAVSYGKQKFAFRLNDSQVLVDQEPTTLRYPVTAAQGAPMIAAEDMKTLVGFSYNYNANANMLLLAK